MTSLSIQWLELRNLRCHIGSLFLRLRLHVKSISKSRPSALPPDCLVIPSLLFLSVVTICVQAVFLSELTTSVTLSVLSLFLFVSLSLPSSWQQATRASFINVNWIRLSWGLESCGAFPQNKKPLTHHGPVRLFMSCLSMFSMASSTQWHLKYIHSSTDTWILHSSNVTWFLSQKFFPFQSPSLS